MNIQAPGGPKIPLLLTGVTATLSFLLLVYIHSTSQNALQKYVPWVDASMEIKIEVALAHLWLEEVMSGDSNESIDVVRNHVENAKWYAIAILDGDQNEQGTFLPLLETDLRLQVNQILYMIQQFHKVIEERYSSAVDAGSGSDLDQSFDLLFLNIMSATAELEMSLKKQIHEEHQAQNSLLLMLMLAICTMTLITGYAIWRFTSNRSKYINKLAVAHQRISEQNAQLKELAHTDQLTGLPNRKMLEAITNQALSRVQRKHCVLSLTFIDLDFFKPINDEFGHNVGDKVLTNFTKAITTQLRDGDVLARLAGDEFILLIQEGSEDALKDALDNIIARIQLRLEEPIISAPSEIHIRCSAGTAFAPRDAIEFEMLLHCADQAMYESKNRGRGQHCYYEPESIDQAELPLEACDAKPDLATATE